MYLRNPLLCIHQVYITIMQQTTFILSLIKSYQIWSIIAFSNLKIQQVDYASPVVIQ